MPLQIISLFSGRQELYSRTKKIAQKSDACKRKFKSHNSHAALEQKTTKLTATKNAKVKTGQKLAVSIFQWNSFCPFLLSSVLFACIFFQLSMLWPILERSQKMLLLGFLLQLSWRYLTPSSWISGELFSQTPAILVCDVNWKYIHRVFFSVH